MARTSRVLALTVTVGCMVAACSEPATGPPPVTNESPALPAVTVPLGQPLPSIEPPGHDQHHPSPPPVPSHDQAVHTAAQFAAAWVADVPASTWWAQVRRWCEPGLAQALRSTDPGNVPAGIVTGPPVITGGSYEEGLRLQVPTDTGTLLLTTAALDGAWLVSGIDFTRTVATEVRP